MLFAREALIRLASVLASAPMRAVSKHPFFARLVALALLALPLAGCPVIFPEVATPVKSLLPGAELTPPPPEDLRWLRFVGASIPDQTRDGRDWSDRTGSPPNPYAKLVVDGGDFLKTFPQSRTREPTWPDSPHGNFRLKPGAKLRVELWDNNALTDLPIGVRELGRLSEEMIASRRIHVDFDNGASVELALEPAHAMRGVGLWYELHTGSAYITRTFAESPASRAGLKAGDQVLAIGKKQIAHSSSDEIQSLFNAVPIDGLEILLRRKSGVTTTVKVPAGPIYPLASELVVD